MNNHVHPLFQNIIAPMSPRNPLQEASEKLAAQERELAFKADVIRAQALRIESLKSILEDIAPSDLESDEPDLYGMRIPQSVVIKTVMDVINSDRQFWSEMLEENFAAWVKRERDAADIASWEDRQP